MDGIGVRPGAGRRYRHFHDPAGRIRTACRHRLVILADHRNRPTTTSARGPLAEHASVRKCHDKPHPEQTTAPPGPPQPARRDTAVGGDSETACSCITSVGVKHGQTRTTAR
ncbi:hypothetical protein AXA44_47340 [Rhodococcus sp. SC4]|nr:hypothetical protein AXA44_47340 [Rhodococcus sp. SC4]KXX56714.1 hypothetical protein AZG88_48870 [Rhodococcus sp. LB1]